MCWLQTECSSSGRHHSVSAGGDFGGLRAVTKLELKMFHQTHTARKPPKSPPAGTEWCCSLLLHAVSASAYHSYAVQGVTGALSTFFCSWWPWPLTFDLDIQTLPSENPNTSSLWISHKSVQRFPWYLRHKQKQTNKKITDGARNRTFTQFITCDKMMNREKYTLWVGYLLDFYSHHYNSCFCQIIRQQCIKYHNLWRQNYAKSYPILSIFLVNL